MNHSCIGSPLAQNQWFKAKAASQEFYEGPRVRQEDLR
jgi:hypothetical protein